MPIEDAAAFTCWRYAFWLLLDESFGRSDEIWYLAQCRRLADNLELLLGGINQVQHGRTILVDTASQYGIIYPYVAGHAILRLGGSQ